ncbi:MAG: beta-lactamase family protein [Myxococcaceae bacterium]|nr:beta-lactamase family protein [Myxococcaceae bacterium]
MRLLFFSLLACSAFAKSIFELDAHIQNQLRRGQFVGASVAVVENGEISLVRSYGLIKKGKSNAVNEDTIFQIGSISKPMSATLAALLEQKEQLSIESSDARYILSHTTGYSRSGWNKKIESGTGRSSLIEQLSRTTHRAPGIYYDYHNVAFSQIEEMIESATRFPFEYAMKKNLFEPLKMDRTSIGSSNFRNIKNMAWPHVPYRKGFTPSSNFSHFYHDNVPSAAGVNSTGRDMAEYLKFMLTHKELGKLWEPYVRTAHSDAVFRAFKFRKPKTFYGYGFRRMEDLNDEILVFHGGWVKGFRSFIAFNPDKKLGIVILANAETSFPYKTAFWFMEND